MLQLTAQEMGEQEPVLGALCCVGVGLSKKLHLSRFWALTIILTCISIIPISLSLCISYKSELVVPTMRNYDFRQW